MEPSSEELVRTQYEKFPYPPLPFLALPLRKEGQALSYELGTQLSRGQSTSHRGIRILVAGGGTLEPLIVAQTHPFAKEVVTVDLSQTSLQILKRRVIFARLVRPRTRLPAMRFFCQDLTQGISSLGQFDYILVSNVIHHVADPAALLGILTQALKSAGILRVVTYPKASRIWMRRTGAWLKQQGLHPGSSHLVKRVRELALGLALEDPIRSCILSHSEASTSTGIVDGWMHRCENPLSPLEWKSATETFGLRLIGETQSDSSRSSFLDEIVPELRGLNVWSKLQILDDLLELCANPILWFEKSSTPVGEVKFSQPAEFPQEPRSELKEGLLRIQALLKGSGVDLADVFQRFKTQVGPRVDPKTDTVLPGLAITDYSLREILGTEL